MAEKYEVRIEAERFIHNDLSGCAHEMLQIMRRINLPDETGGVFFVMMSSLIFSAFSIEAKVNFVGWKVLEKGWPERASLTEKIDLLIKVLPLDLKWGERPLQTIAKLSNFRNTLAHGKPDIVDKTVITHVRPEVWDALKGEWESSVTPENVERCYDDTEKLWEILLDVAQIPASKTITHGGHRLS